MPDQPRDDTSPRTLRLHIEGMHCASCVGRIEGALQNVPGVQSAQVNLATETAEVAGNAALPAETLVTAVKSAGYLVQTQQLTLNIDKMTCASCTARVQNALAAVPGVLSASVNL